MEKAVFFMLAVWWQAGALALLEPWYLHDLFQGCVYVTDYSKDKQQPHCFKISVGQKPHNAPKQWRSVWFKMLYLLYVFNENGMLFFYPLPTLDPYLSARVYSSLTFLSTPASQSKRSVLILSKSWLIEVNLLWESTGVIFFTVKIQTFQII